MRSDIPVREIMTREVCTAKKDDSVLTLARKMIEYGVGSAVIIENGKPIGIVTEKDLISKIVARDKVPSRVKVEEIMTSPIITIRPNTSLREAADIMIKKGIRRLPIVNDSGDLVGIITDNDILSVSLDLGEFAALLTENAVGYPEEEFYSGICDKCGRYSDKLIEVNGLRLCEDCAESEG